MDEISYNKGREDQAKYSVDKLRNRELSIRFMSKIVGYDEETVRKWIWELEYEEGFQLGKLEQARYMSRRLHKMGLSIKDIADVVEYDAKTVTEWIESETD